MGKTRIEWATDTYRAGRTNSRTIRSASNGLPSRDLLSSHSKTFRLFFELLQETQAGAMFQGLVSPPLEIGTI